MIGLRLSTPHLDGSVELRRVVALGPKDSITKLVAKLSCRKLARISAVGSSNAVTNPDASIKWLESSGTGSEIVADIFCSRLRQYYTCVGVSMGIIDLRTEMGEAGSQSL